MKIYNQTSRFKSPWTIGKKIKILLWEYIWVILCRWTPKRFNKWRLFWLKLFGTKINGKPFVHQRSKIDHPWNLILHDRACLGDGAVAYALDKIELFENATIAQEAYLCTGTHDFEDPVMSLKTDGITIKSNAFIGARAFVLPGVTIGEGAVICPGSVITKDVPPWVIAAGVPTRFIGKRDKVTVPDL